MTDGFTLRRATDADIDAVRALTREAYAKWVPIAGREPKPMVADYAKAVREHRIDLLHQGGDLVALIETITQPDHLLIENVAVAPSRQGRGLGRRLLTHAEAIARAGGYGEIRLYTNKLFTANIELYRRFGYGIDREEPFSRGVIVHMRKPITTT